MALSPSLLLESSTTRSFGGLKLHVALHQYLASSKIKSANSVGKNDKRELRTAKISSGVWLWSDMRSEVEIDDSDSIKVSEYALVLKESWRPISTTGWIREKRTFTLRPFFIYYSHESSHAATATRPTVDEIQISSKHNATIFHQMSGSDAVCASQSI